MFLLDDAKGSETELKNPLIVNMHKRKFYGISNIIIMASMCDIKRCRMFSTYMLSDFKYKRVKNSKKSWFEGEMLKRKNMKQIHKND